MQITYTHQFYFKVFVKILFPQYLQQVYFLYYHNDILPADCKYNDKGNQEKNDWNDDSHKEGSVVRVSRNLSRPFGFTKYFPSCVCSNFEPVSHKLYASMIYNYLRCILFSIALSDTFIYKIIVTCIWYPALEARCSNPV